MVEDLENGIIYLYLIFGILVLVGMIYIVYLIYKKCKEQEQIRNEIYHTSASITGIVVDMLIYMRGQESTRVYPIVKDVLNNKIYVSFQNYDHTTPLIYYTRGIGSFTYKLKVRGKEINIGDTVKIYIKQEIGKLHNANNLVCIDNNNYRYYGRRENMRQWQTQFVEYHKLLNEVSDDFLSDVNDMILYEGFIEPIAD